MVSASWYPDVAVLGVESQAVVDAGETRCYLGGRASISDFVA
jgi:hypothetical protein